MKEECLGFKWKALFSLLGEWKALLVVWGFIIVIELLLNR